MKNFHIATLLIVLTIHTINNSASAQQAPILDIAGNPLQTGTRYYALPVIRGRGGGLTLTSLGNSTCPLYVAQEPQEVQNGFPLTLSPVTGESIVRESVDLNIQFSASTICVNSNIWRLNRDESIGQYVVIGDGVAGNPGAQTISNWFNIQRYESDYRIVFCPTVCNTCRPICGDLGVLIQGGRRVLFLNLNRTAAPFRVMFRQA